MSSGSCANDRPSEVGITWRSDVREHQCGLRKLLRHGIDVCLIALVALLAQPAAAQVDPPPLQLDPITVTATRSAERSFDVPASVDVIDGATIRAGSPAIDISEPLVRVPGIFAASRGNYAQDIQISSRGFGARATFGVRGVRLYQDFIPVTMPDGQGQTGSFSLLSAQRIEVLRGPFSTLYGNASGGVIAVFTEDGAPVPTVGFTANVGSYATSNIGIRASGMAANVGYVAAANRFDTDGYRDHAAATRDVVNAKLVFAPTTDLRVTVIGSSQNQPDSQDPLGLTQAQWDANPRQADPVATLFNTRKSVTQLQGGAALEYQWNDSSTLRVTGYGGQRQVTQYLAFTGAAPGSSGGVVDLDRDYGGVGARLIVKTTLGGQPLTLTGGVDTDRMRETRQGFVNDFGVQGALRRDENDTVRSVDVYAEGLWQALPALAFTLGVRSSRVDYSVDDQYITGQNPDDSGSRRYTNTSPVAGVVWDAAEDLRLYASYGQGFETPTLAELAYSPLGTGPNLGLAPALATSWEIGLKWLPTARQRVNLAVFTATTEQEIVVDTATGGRTTYRNAGRTTRRGVEAMWDAVLGAGFAVHANYTYLQAEFADDFVSGIPPAIVRAGSRLPGVPAQQAYGIVSWTPGGFAGFNAAIEMQHVGKLYANDRNTAFAPAYTTGNARVGFAQKAGPAEFTQYLRVNNITARNYSGSVIVNDTNARYFEPSPLRNWMAGVSIAVRF